MMLWPQAWPRPGRASISAVKVTRGRPADRGETARKAVGIDGSMSVTAKPSASRTDRRRREVRMLLEGELGIGVDAPAQVEDLRAAVLDGLGDPLPYVHRCSAPMIIQKEK